jgi:FixJ family two-component response regulator
MSPVPVFWTNHLISLAMRKTQQKIFFVDDESDMRTTITATLVKEGYDVTCFANAKSCIAEIEEDGCHLLISDVKMPDMDGLELLNRVKQIAPWIPVILITGYGNIQMAVYATKIGAADFIEKPFSRATFVERVKATIVHNEYNGQPTGCKLTKTEKKVLKLILDGCSNKEIAQKLDCALRTVEYHHSNIYRKFKVDNAVELTKKAMTMSTSNES